MVHLPETLTQATKGSPNQNFNVMQTLILRTNVTVRQILKLVFGSVFHNTFMMMQQNTNGFLSALAR
jgi:hypothetical protein